MSHTPKVSVILTSYNHAKYLQAAIDSVVNQTFLDFELIIWDDHSVDNSWEIINSYSDHRIKSYRNDENKGGVRGVNKAISEIAQGEYIAIQNSDDLWLPEKLEKQVAFLDANPQIGAVFTWAQIIDENGNPFQDQNHFYYQVFEQPNRTRYEWLNYFFYHGNALCHPSLLIRKLCYEDVGLYRFGFAQLPDFDMWVRLCLKYDISVLPEKLVRFRVLSSEMNTSGNRPETRIRSYFEYFQVLNNYKNISRFEELKKIFPVAHKHERKDGGDIEFALGMIAIEEGTQQFYTLYGFTLLFEALNDSDRAKKILEQYDFSSKDLVNLIGEKDIFSIETIRDLNTQIAERDTQIAEREAQIQALSGQLVEIRFSKDWQIAMLLRKVRIFLFPPGSWRFRLAKRFYLFFIFLIRISSNSKVKRDLRLLQNSGYFDREWYLVQNPDVAQAGVDPTRHFLLNGGFEGRDPGPHFSSRWYLSSYPDVNVARINPLLHYLRFGCREGRLANPQGGQPQDAQGIESIHPLSMLRIVRKIFQENGGVKGIVTKSWIIIRQSGFRGLWHRSYQKLKSRKLDLPTAKELTTNLVDVEYHRFIQFQIVPYYLDPYKTASANSSGTQSVAIHLHLFKTDSLDDCALYFQNIPIAFDLFISSSEIIDVDMLEQSLREQLPHLRKLVFRKTPNCGLDIVPFVVEFGKELLNYDFIAHIHNQDRSLIRRYDELAGTLFSSSSNINQIFELLQSDAKFVYLAPSQELLLEDSGWGEHFSMAEKFAKSFLNIDIEQYKLVEYPRDSIFWTTSAALSEFLKFPFRYTDFLPESELSASAVSGALVRLLLISAQKIEGRNYRIYSPVSTIIEPHYENSNDYSEKIVHDTVKVFSYYLPQFYAIPENDQWHGKGFTEWNKVRSATPLFYGHYQQRIPHEDIGYYSLNTTDVLKLQSKWMKQAGVYGQVFYHYWFSGRMILEKPSQMLLDDKSIDMPFCFCWANENWTRKWDGNEDEILLGQTYSEQDAENFINYLIPFFKDERYIKVDGRPVLFIYRPSSIPNFSLYKEAWEKICAQHSLPKPYVIAILTRGAMSPNEFGMDAGCERVLHDWTDGNVKEIKGHLHPYRDLKGSVLDYTEVADYYTNQPANKDFTYFRSIIPSWDNSPRYGSEAYVIHNSTPEKFQEWLENLIVDAERRLPEDRRFILINAWNEWAESAVLDPDKRFGYAYLNSIGRALSGIKFTDREYIIQTIPTNLQLNIILSDELIGVLKKNQEQGRKMLSCLAKSTIFSMCKVSFNQLDIVPWLKEANQLHMNEGKNEESDYTLYLNGLCYFTPDAIEYMLKMALRYDVGVVVPSIINDENFTHANLLERWKTNTFSISSLPPVHLEKNGDKCAVKCCVDAKIFISNPEVTKINEPDVVSTIVRFHQSADLNLLQNALYSLLAQNDCIIQPMIAVQDLSSNALEQFESMLSAMPWNPEHMPIVKKYFSDMQNRDLRSLMLNEMFKLAQTNYVAFLDYDDTLFPHAYAYLIKRLKKTGKNASFGLIYTTSFNLSEKKITQRQVVYDRGKSFADFIKNNHSPLHGFMFDVSKIDLNSIEFSNDMKYMEDYFLTLQIFTEKDTDWESLRHRHFIGDYYHYEDKSQTLALSDDKRIDILKKPEYIACERKINEMRQRVLARKR